MALYNSFYNLLQNQYSISSYFNNKYSLEYRYYANQISNGLEYLVSSGFDFLILRYEDNSSGYAFYSIKSYLDLLTSIRDYNKENNADNNKVMAIS